MRLTAAILCDAATVRDGLLNVLSGGLTRIERPSYPNVLGMTFAALLSNDDPNVPQFELVVAIIAEPDRQIISTRLVGTPLANPTAPPEGPEMVPVVIPLAFVIPSEGHYRVVASLGEDTMELAFVAAIQGPPPTSNHHLRRRRPPNAGRLRRSPRNVRLRNGRARDSQGSLKD
jgi:hypothetical protein